MFKFRVCTYNVLADKYLQSSIAGHPVVPSYLLWPVRSKKLLSNIDGIDADVVCLQEVEEPVWTDDWSTHFKALGYDGCTQMRNTGYVPGPSEGTVLMWRTSVFDLQRSETFQFKDWLAEAHTAGSKATERVDGGILAVLKHKQSQRVLIALCTHLFWDPKFPEVKVLQAEALSLLVAAKLRELQLTASDTPIIIGGDFNSLWRKYASDAFDTLPPGVPYLTSGVYQLLSTGKLSEVHHDHPNQRSPPALRESQITTGGLQLKSAFCDFHGHEPALTTRTAHFEGTLDYIWLSRQHFRVDGTCPLPFSDSASASEIALGACPNADEPSDHLSLACDVTLLDHTNELQ